jgi:alkaline phosphatase D
MPAAGTSQDFLYKSQLPSMKLQLLSALSSVAIVGVGASWTKNINYRSPSEHHPSLGISIHKVVKRNDPTSPWDPAKLHFTHGVASGDPYPESVIIWTRVSPTEDNDKSNVTVAGYVKLFNHDVDEYVAVSKAPVCVEYKVSTDAELTDVCDSGTVYTSSDVDYTVKVEAKNLKPFTQYYYQFNVCGSENKSPLGRTKTTPNADDDITKVSLAVYSCANFPFGFFNAYGNPVRKVSTHETAQRRS